MEQLHRSTRSGKQTCKRESVTRITFFKSTDLNLINQIH